MKLSDTTQEISKKIEAKKKLLAKLGPLSQAALKRLESDLPIERTYSSNAIAEFATNCVVA